jgi:hypothetical protein
MRVNPVVVMPLMASNQASTGGIRPREKKGRAPITLAQKNDRGATAAFSWVVTSLSGTRPMRYQPKRAVKRPGTVKWITEDSPGAKLTAAVRRKATARS